MGKRITILLVAALTMLSVAPLALSAQTTSNGNSSDVVSIFDMKFNPQANIPSKNMLPVQTVQSSVNQTLVRNPFAVPQLRLQQNIHDWSLYGNTGSKAPMAEGGLGRHVQLIFCTGYDATGEHRGLTLMNLDSPDVSNWQSLNTPEVSYYSYGSAYYNGEFYGVHIDVEEDNSGRIQLRPVLDRYSKSAGWRLSFIYPDGENTWTDLEDFDWSRFGSVTAVAPDGTVYGQFYNSNRTGLRYVKVKYSLEGIEVTDLAPAKLVMAALGVSKEGKLYGIGADANLYMIDLATGAEVLVGSTGVEGLAAIEGATYDLQNYSGRVYNPTGLLWAQGGEIDQYDNTFYWYYTKRTDNYEAALVAVDINTGKATKLYQADYNVEPVNLFVMPREFAAEVPEQPQELSIQFASLSTTGEVSFIAPTETYAGKALDASAKLTYKIVVYNTNNPTGAEVKVESNQALPGKENKFYIIDDAIQNDALNRFEVSIIDEKTGAEGPAAIQEVWVGRGIPQAPSNVVYAVKDNPDGTKTCEITWTAPVEGENAGVQGGYVKASELKYNVYLYIGPEKQELIDKDLTQLKTTYDITNNALLQYSFAVEAVNNGNPDLASSETDGLSARQWIGDPLSVPCLSFLTQPRALYTFINADGDYYAWDYSIGQLSYYNEATTSNDWAIFPGVKLTKGRNYKFQVLVASPYNDEHFEVLAGTGQSVEDLTISVIPEITAPLSRMGANFIGEFIAPADGTYFIGFHAMNVSSIPRGRRMLLIQNASVEDGNALTAPVAAENLTIKSNVSETPDADFTFKAPSKTIEGKDLTASDLLTVTAYVNDNEIQRWADVAPGTELTGHYHSNDAAASGLVTISIRAALDSQVGQLTSASAYLGWDNAVKVPTGVYYEQGENTLLAHWDIESPVTGEHGGYLPGDFHRWGEIVTNETRRAVEARGESEWNDNVLKIGTFNPNDGSPAVKQIAIAAGSKDYDGNTIYGLFRADRVVVGKPAQLPMVENGDELILNNVVDVRSDNDFASQFLAMGYAGYGMVEDITGHDGYTLGTFSYYPDIYFWLDFQKVSMEGTVSPKLSFDVVNVEPANTLDVVVYKPNGEKVILESIGETTLEPEHREYDLKQFAGLKFIQLRLVNNFKKATAFYYDNILIYDEVASNMAAYLVDAPRTVKAGQKVPVNVSVGNFGSEKVSNWKVVLKEGDKVLAEHEVNEYLEGGETRTIQLSFTATSTTATGSSEAISDKTLSAGVVAEGDMKASDDFREFSLLVRNHANSTTPDLLVAAEAEDASINVVWDFSGELKEGNFEDFEDEAYDPFTVGGITIDNHEGFLGPWSLYDGDGCITYSWAVDESYVNRFAPMAWQLFNPDYASLNNRYASYPAHSGNYYLLSANPVDFNYVPEADDWLISPLLIGGSDLSFYYSVLSRDPENYATFEVLYSTTDNKPASFTNVLDNVVTYRGDEGSWTEYSATLPADAKYFAIRHTTSTAVALAIDDIDYVTKAEAVGYNIYLDGVFVGTVASDVFTYTIAEGAAPGNHTIGVTILFADGTESMPSYAQVTTAIDGIVNTGKPFDVYSVDGKLIRQQTTTTSGLKGVYVIDNKKVILK